MAKKSVTLLENEVGLPGSESDPDMGFGHMGPTIFVDSADAVNAATIIDIYVADEDAVHAMTDVMGGSGDARFRSTRILARFASEGWRIVKGN